MQCVVSLRSKAEASASGHVSLTNVSGCEKITAYPRRDQPQHDVARRATVVWNLFDAEADVAQTARNRPHWGQNGALTFVTIRLIDSMPKAVAARWLAEQAQ